MTEYYLGRVPQPFPEAVKEMRRSLTVDEAEVMRNLFAVCVSEGEHKSLEDGIQLAEKHFDNGDEASAWYVLLTVAEQKGMIQGYTEKRYENERPEALRQKLVEGGHHDQAQAQSGPDRTGGAVGAEGARGRRARGPRRVDDAQVYVLAWH